MNPKYFKPELDTPYSIALKYPTPKAVQGFSGPELRWILSDGLAFYTPPDFADKLKALGIKAGQPFQVEKRSDGRKAEWIVSHLPDSQPGKGAPQKAVSLTAQAGPLDAPFGLDEANPQPSTSGSQTALAHALKTAVAAAAEAEKHAERLGYSCRFSSADIRAMGISVLIGLQSGRAA